MSIRNATAKWQGGLKDGSGHMEFGNGSYNGAYSFSSRFEEGEGTNPEELIAAAHAGCFSMALSAGLEKNGFQPNSVSTKANVHLEKLEDGFKITKILLETEANVPGIAEEQFQEIAKSTSTGCPVSVALQSVPIEVEASLVTS